MYKTYLFDWGDTLMVDFPNSNGKMCDWEVVEAIDGAKEALSNISKKCQIYIATSADASVESDIKLAFERVGLAQYITGYFCKDNVGIKKGSKEFYLTIVNKLQLKPNDVVMVGDTIKNDIVPALEAGLSVIWFNPMSKNQDKDASIKEINNLRELYIS
jgi:putative hydrolase of the HAD superfamily